MRGSTSSPAVPREWSGVYCLYVSTHEGTLHIHVHTHTRGHVGVYVWTCMCVCVYTDTYVLIPRVHPIAHHPRQPSCCIHRDGIKRDPAEAMPLPPTQCVRWETHGEPPSHPPLWIPEQTQFLPASCPRAIRQETAEKHQPGASASYTQLLEQLKPKPLDTQSCFQWFQLHVLCLSLSP